MTEKRKADRHKTYKGGSINFGTTTVDCIVRDLSATGAALQIQTQSGVPDNFTLIIRPERWKRSCKVAWRSPRRVGVLFA